MRLQVNVVTPSNVEQDKEIAQTARLALDRYIKQEYTLGLEKTAFELEKKMKDYFGNYRCLIKEEINTRPSRNNNRNQNNNNNGNNDGGYRNNNNNNGNGFNSNNNNNNRGYNPIDNSNRATQTDLIFDGPTSRSSSASTFPAQSTRTGGNSYRTTTPGGYYEYRRMI